MTSFFSEHTMHIWQLQEAKAKLTQLIKDAKLEPQIISRHGTNEVVILSIEKYEELFQKKEDFITFLRKSPLCESELDLTRDTSLIREIEF